MKITISSELAKTRHSAECQMFLEYLRASKTKAKNTPEADFEYSYSWSERIEGDSFADIMTGKALARQKAEQERSLEMKILARVNRSSVALLIKAGRVSKYFPIAGHFPGTEDRTGWPIPVEVFEEIKEQETKQAKEQDRINSLTPEQRQAEIDEALACLRGSPGFMEFHLPRQ